MPRYIEGTGNTIEEAVKNALEKAGFDINEEVEYELVSENPLRVRVYLKREFPELDMVEEEVKKFIEKMGGRATVFIEIMEPNKYYVNIRTRRLDNMLIGKEGKVLREFSYLMSIILKKKLPEATFVIDVAGYKRRRERYLINKAIATARQALETGMEYTLDPMEASERRKVKEALREIDGIRVYTVGRGRDIRLVIAPLKKERDNRDENPEKA